MRTLFLTLITCLFVLPAHAKYSGGTGEPDDPYQIATAEDLIALGNEPNDYDKHFILTADIDLDPNLPGRKVFDRAVVAPDVNDTESGFQGTLFTGVLDGSGHKISNLTITGKDYLGLFGRLGPRFVSRLGYHIGDVNGLGVVDVNITGAGSYIGGLVGLNYGAVNQCSSTGLVNGSDYVGGLVGAISRHGGPRMLAQRSYITDSCSTASVIGERHVGGLVGANAQFDYWGSSGTLAQCYSTGPVSGNSHVGGLVGSNGGTVTHCYSASTLSGECVGGLVGQNSGNITSSYSSGSVSGTIIGDVGGLVGDGDPLNVTHSVWDTQTSGLYRSVGGVGLTTSEMTDPHMLGLNGFANDPNWVLDAGRDYPRLAWERTPGGIISEPSIDWLEGQGTEEEPYRVDATNQLILLSKAPVLWDEHLILGTDVDLNPALPGRCVFGQAPIQVFMGVFDGNGHTISHLTITGDSYLGLFGRLESAAEVRDLGLVDVNISGAGYIGGLVGYNHEGTVTGCYSTGVVSGGSNVGGLAGYSSSGSHVTQCSSTGTVSGNWTVGGLVGDNYGSVTQCYSNGAVRGNRDVVGGLVGSNGGPPGLVGDCYSTCGVSGTNNVGGLVGRNGSYVTYSYSIGTVTATGNDVGGMIGAGPSVVIASFWDMQTSGQATSAGGTGKTTAEMQTAKTFLAAGWDFVGETANGTEDVWWILEGKDYPRLWWEAK